MTDEQFALQQPPGAEVVRLGQTAAHASSIQVQDSEANKRK